MVARDTVGSRKNPRQVAVAKSKSAGIGLGNGSLWVGGMFVYNGVGCGCGWIGETW